MTAAKHADSGMKAPGVAVVFERSGLARGRAAVTRFCREVLATALAELQDPDASLTVLLAGDERLQQLNRDFRGMDAPTDVLSFPAIDKPKKRPRGQYLGDLAISVPYMLRSAAKRRRDADEELALLLVHGLLHLLGHDHDIATRKSRMWSEQKRLLKACGAIARPGIGKTDTEPLRAQRKSTEKGKKGKTAGRKKAQKAQKEKK